MTARELKHILFDFDGTIADSSGLMLEVLHQLAEQKRIQHFTAEDLFQFMGIPIRERLKKLGVSFFHLPRLMLEGLGIYSNLTPSLKLFEGLKPVILGLKADGFRLSIISSNSVENIHNFLKQQELDCFDELLSAKLFGKHRVMGSYLKRNKLSPEEALYVGDELRDIEASRKARVPIVSVTWGYDSLELLKKGGPDFLAYQPHDIRAIIDSLGAQAE